MNKPAYPCIHYSELEPFSQPSTLDLEWETYRKEVGRLIAEGHEGRFVLIRGSEIVAFYDSQRDAHRAGLCLFGVFGRFFFHQVQTYERILKVGPLGWKRCMAA